MATLIGIVVDVSGSMKTRIGDTRYRGEGEWARANFDLVDDLIKHDVSSRNHVFAIGFGAENEPTSFDLLNTLDLGKTESVYADLTFQEKLERILSILEDNGASRVRKWGKMNVLLSTVDEADAALFLDRLSRDSVFRDRFVTECLPDECRGINVKTLGDETAYAGLRGVKCFARAVGINPVARATEKRQESAIKDGVKEVVEKGKKLLSELPPCVTVNDDAVMDVHKARRILHGCVRKDDLTDQRVDELMDQVGPLIFGGSPLMAALNAAKRLFAIPKFKDHNKLLFILSDGEPADGRSPPVKDLTKLGVKTVSCYITNNPVSDPKRLYSKSDSSWDSAAQLMFQMSSTIQTQLIPRTIFVKRGWKIDIEDNETRLFVQANHPDVIEEACGLARDVVCCQDALSDLLSSISLDLYINKANEGFKPKRQQEGTCYANASAAVLHLSMQRIVGREGGYPDFFQLRHEIIEKYGQHGANTLRVLRDVCPLYRLKCREVDVIGALKAVAEKRPVVARFRLTDTEWDSFSEFYRTHPRGILSSSDLNMRRPTGEDLSGHAVVLTSYDSRGLRLMNSWGDTWADGGFF